MASHIQPLTIGADVYNGRDVYTSCCCGHARLGPLRQAQVFQSVFQAQVFNRTNMIIYL
jgi:hypothetical protein|eukprot:COSAG01_NODE_2052_length_8544_cov_8.628034_3_plen_59_part_00